MGGLTNKEIGDLQRHVRAEKRELMVLQKDLKKREKARRVRTERGIPLPEHLQQSVELDKERRASYENRERLLRPKKKALADAIEERVTEKEAAVKKTAEYEERWRKLEFERDQWAHHVRRRIQKEEKIPAFERAQAVMDEQRRAVAQTNNELLQALEAKKEQDMIKQKKKPDDWSEIDWEIYGP